MINLKKTISAAAFSLLVLPGWSSLYADLFYTPREYNYLYSEKVALEIELKSLKQQFMNEKTVLLGTVRDLELRIDSLNREIEYLEKENLTAKARHEKALDESRKLIEVMKGSRNELEKRLVDENRALQERFDKAASKLADDNEKLSIRFLDEIKKIKQDYEKTITALRTEISNLDNELSELKRLNSQQRVELNRMERQAADLEKQLTDEIKKGDIRLKRFHDRLIINLDDKICFDSGYADLKKEVLPSLKKISNILQQYPEYSIVIEGHTDNVPIKTAKFRNNWQLSTERALSVLDYLLQENGLSPARFTASGYGEYRPILPNDSKENRALNRRVDIVVIPVFKKDQVSK